MQVSRNGIAFPRFDCSPEADDVDSAPAPTRVPTERPTGAPTPAATEIANGNSYSGWQLNDQQKLPRHRRPSRSRLSQQRIPHRSQLSLPRRRRVRLLSTSRHRQWIRWPLLLLPNQLKCLNLCLSIEEKHQSTRLLQQRSQPMYLHLLLFIRLRRQLIRHVRAPTVTPKSTRVSTNSPVYPTEATVEPTNAPASPTLAPVMLPKNVSPTMGLPSNCVTSYNQGNLQLWHHRRRNPQVWHSLRSNLPLQ